MFARLSGLVGALGSLAEEVEVDGVSAQVSGVALRDCAKSDVDPSDA